MCINIGLIRVVTLEDEKLLNIHGNILEKKFNHFKIESKCIEDQYQGIYDDITEEMAIGKIIELAKDFEKAGKDVILISCAADPAVEKVRKEVRIPVIGAGSSCASIALSYSRKVGILGIGAVAPLVMEKILGDSLVDYIKPRDVNNTLDLLNENRKENVLEAAKYLKDKGCNIIALGCTGLATIEIANEIKSKLNIPVIDPLIASGMIIDYVKEVFSC